MGFGLIKALIPRAAFRNADRSLSGVVPPAARAPLINADVYYHEASFPVSSARLLGTFKIDEPVYFKLALAQDTDVAIRTIGRGARGLKTDADVAEAEPDLYRVKGLTAGVASLKENDGYSYARTLPPQPTINFNQSFKLTDDPAHQETDITTYGVPTGMLNLKTDKFASGVIAVTTGTITTGALSTVICAARLDLQPNQGIYIAGAAGGGNALVTTITAVSDDGKTFQLAAPAAAPVTAALVQADDTLAVQNWINAKGDLAMPPGYYRLTSSIILPPVTEGFSIVIHGSGWDLSVFAFQHAGDGFVASRTGSTTRFDSIVFKDCVIATGTIGDDQGTVNAANRGHGISFTEATNVTGIYDQLVLDTCRVIGWGRWGIWTDNLEVSWLKKCIFRLNKSGHVAFVAPDEIGPNKQPNANVIEACTFDSAFSDPSNARTASGSMTAGSNVLTISGAVMTLNDRGCAVIVHGCGTSGSYIYSYIDNVVSGSQVQLAYQAQQTQSGVTVEIFPVNVASIFLNRANDTVIDGVTIQGNFAKDATGANIPTPTANDCNAIRADQCFNLRIVGVHEEDNAGYGGAAIRLQGCKNVTIENYGGTSQGYDGGGAPLHNAHGQDFKLIDSHGVRVAQCYFNDRPQFVIDDVSSEVSIDNAWVVGHNNLWQHDASWDRLRIGSGVRTQQSASMLTNQVGGNEYLFDSLLGVDLLANGRFLDPAVGGGFEGWTTTNPTWWSIVFDSLFRFGTYIKVDATGIADNGGLPATLFHQTVAIPDSLAAQGGHFCLAFDWYIESEGGSPFNGRYQEVRLHPSSGTDEALQWVTRGFPYVTGRWQTAEMHCFLNAGTGRTLDVQINATPGPDHPVMRFANFRLTPTKHSFGAWERGVHDFGGRMRAPLEFVPTSAVNYPPPASGSSMVSIANIAGVLNIGHGGVYAPVGGSITGTQFHFPIFKTDGTLGDVSHLQEDYANFRMTFNWLTSATENAAHALLLRPNLNDNGVAVQPRQDPYTGVAFAYQDYLNAHQFVVNALGELAYIKGVQYSWPTSAALPPAGSGEMRVLCYTNTSGIPTLQWLPPPGSGTGTISAGDVNRIARYTTAVTIGDSGIEDDGASINIFGSFGRSTLRSDTANNLALGNASYPLKQAFFKGGASSSFPVVLFDVSGTNASTITRGVSTSAQSTAGGTAENFYYQIYGDRNVLQSGDQWRTTLASYYGIELRGSRLSLSRPALFAGDAAGNDASVAIKCERDVDVLRLQFVNAGASHDHLQLRDNVGNMLGKINATADLFFEAATFANLGTAPQAWAGQVMAKALLLGASGDVTTPPSGYSRSQGTVDLVTYPNNTVPSVPGVNYMLRLFAYQFNSAAPSQLALRRDTGAAPSTLLVPAGIGVNPNDTFGWDVSSGSWKVISAATGTSIAASGTVNTIPKVTTLSPVYTLGDSGISDDGSAITFARRLVGSGEGTVNLGDVVGHRFGGGYFINTVQCDTTGTTYSSPKSIGFWDMAGNPAPGASAEAGQFWLYNSQAVIKAGNRIRTVVMSYFGIDLRGQRATTADLTGEPIGQTTDPSVYIYAERTNTLVLSVDCSNNTTANLLEVRNSGVLKFSVTSAGVTTALGQVNAPTVQATASGNAIVATAGNIAATGASAQVIVRDSGTPGGNGATLQSNYLALAASTVNLAIYATLSGSTPVFACKVGGSSLGPETYVPFGNGVNPNDTFLWDTSVAPGRWKVGPIPGGTGSGVSGSGTINRLTRWSTNTNPGTIQDAGFGDDGTDLTMYRNLKMAADGTLNIGWPVDSPYNGNRVGAIYLKNGVFIYPRSSSSSSPTAFGFIPVGAARSSGESCQFLFYGGRNAVQVGDKSRMVFSSYHCIEFQGNRRIDGGATVNDIISLGSSENRCVEIHTTNTVDEALRLNAVSGMTAALLTATVGGAQMAQLSAAGTLWLNGGLRRGVAVIQAGGGSTVDFTPYLNYGIIVLQPTDSFGFTLQLPSIASGYEGYQWRIVVAGWGNNRPVKLLSASGDDINETGVGGTTGWTLNPNSNNTRNGILSCVYFGGSLKQWYYAALIA